MKKLLIVVLSLFVLASCNGTPSPEVEVAQSPGGRQFYFMPVNEKGVTDVTVRVAWPTTWAFDPGKNPTVPYVATETLLSGGTDALAPQDVQELFNDKNSSGRLYTNSDHIYGELIFPIEHLDAVVPVAAEMLATPKFDPAWVERIKQGLKANQEQAQNYSSTKMWNVARRAVLGDSPLAAFLSGTKTKLFDQITVSDLQQWHAATITNAPEAIAVTGAISRKEAGRVVDQLLDGLVAPQALPEVSVQADFSPRTILLHLPEAEKTLVGFVGQLPPTRDGKDLTDLLALQVLGRPGNGPLFDAVRTELRASYGFEAGLTNYDRDIRILYLAGEVETDKLAQAVELVRRTYETFRTNPDLSGLADTRSAMAEETKTNVRYVDVAASVILELALDGRDPAIAPRLGETMEAVTDQEVRDRLQASFPAGDALIVVAASPDATALPGACVVTATEQVAQCR